jgi:hypothetical protein
MKFAPACVAILSHSFVLPSHATDSFWTDPVSGNWIDSSRWTTPQFPNNIGADTFDVFITAANPAYQVALQSSITVGSLTIHSADATILHTGGILELVGDLVVSSGDYRLNGGTISNANIIAAGNFTFLSSPNNIFSNHTVFNGDVNLSTPSATLGPLSQVGSRRSLWSR